MPIMLRSTPEHCIPEPVLALLASTGIPYFVELWSTTGFFCPWCGKHLGRVPHDRRHALPCFRCHKPLWCRVLESAILVTAGDDPATRDI